MIDLDPSWVRDRLPHAGRRCGDLTVMRGKTAAPIMGAGGRIVSHYKYPVARGKIGLIELRSDRGRVTSMRRSELSGDGPK